MAIAEAPVAAGTLTILAAELRRALALVEHATSSEVGWPVLTSVLLSAHEGKLFACAADNYRVSEALIETSGDPSFLGERTTLLPASDRPALMAWLKSVGKDAEVEVTLADGQLVFAYGHRQITLTLMDGQWPAYRQLFDGPVAPVVFAVNPAYLADAGKALAGEGVVKVRAASALSPVFLVKDGYREVVMPVRVSEPG